MFFQKIVMLDIPEFVYLSGEVEMENGVVVPAESKPIFRFVQIYADYLLKKGAFRKNPF